ncbi:hypothetical protein HHK36_025636 [Tetracentron sinense]|uniref:Uncharacterized protein n=1 Tax=Tetracentron sinense TaxID=13715 RepID=A0A835D380_TETSI|nr:hypothetical protein HHK36_025636 [Tetracentron sinense]
MASFSRLNLSFVSSPYSARTKSNNNYVTIRCGPRDNRGPIVRGRILSTEAIQAVQALKRAQRGDETKIDELVSKTLARLIKNDLIASLNELLRQDQSQLALKVFSAVRSEIWYKTDCSLYAEMVMMLARNGMLEEIDRLISEMDGDGFDSGDDRGLARLIKALIAAKRTESTIRVYGLMKKCGWGSKIKADEYVVQVLSRGLRRLGEKSVSDEVDTEFVKFCGGNFEKLSV